MIPYVDTDGRKQYRLKSQKHAWNTDERVLIKKGKGSRQNSAITPSNLSA